MWRVGCFFNVPFQASMLLLGSSLLSNFWTPVIVRLFVDRGRSIVVSLFSELSLSSMLVRQPQQNGVGTTASALENTILKRSLEQDFNLNAGVFHSSDISPLKKSLCIFLYFLGIENVFMFSSNYV